MAHCPYGKLQDIEDVLESVRGWDGIKEKSPGVFYVRSTPFLHFHLKGDRRWADVRDGADWGTGLDVPLGASKALCDAFLRNVRARYERTEKR